MVHDDRFAEDMARELDASIRMLEARQLLIEGLMGVERVRELGEYLEETIESPQQQDEAEMERWLDSRDNEWIHVVVRLKHARQQRVMLGRLCMRMSVDDMNVD
ncbi:MAG: hypothetical protein Q8Q47_05810, partial [Ignavibacteriaceae bacterium]|jgi:hypothetical protein|nr:hypothetical protein [Ignavibacteriaceae bacterium]